MSFETNKFDVVRKKRLEKEQFYVECNIGVDVEIDKILSVCHTAEIDNVEVLNGVINFSGNIDLCVLYSTADGEIGTVSASCPFVSKFESGEIFVDAKASVFVDVEDYQLDSVTGDNIKISCTCSQSAVLAEANMIEYIAGGDENICLKEDEISVYSIVGQGKQTFVINSDVSIKEPIRKIVMTDSQATIKNVECGNNFVSVGGEVVTRLLYLTEKDRFESSYLSESFKEEIELNGASKEGLCEAICEVKKGLVKCEVVENEKGVDVKISVPVEVKVVAYEERKQSVVKDIYSTSGELEIVTESFEMSRQFQTESFDAKIDGNLTLDEDKPRVDKILFVGGSNLMVTNSYLNGNEIVVEGIVKTSVIYLNDETNSINSVSMEVPFVVSDKSNLDCENGKLETRVSVVDVDVVVKKGREFYFDAKLKINYGCDCDCYGAVISRVETKELFGEKDCAIELVFGQVGQTSWDIAKAAKVREETIFLQNPNVAFPLERDENIVIFYQKKG